jgi:uncharacterized protein YceH (UPF0502 family)
MNPALNTVEVRVIGSLIEKQVTTPEYYPLTLNALVNACNQSTNRDPVVAFDEKTVARALESLRDKQLVWLCNIAGNRVPKYEHRLTDKLGLSAAETAALCVLMLRGPQTIGEIRGRTGRMHEFKDLQEVEEIIQRMIEREAPLVVKLPRLPGTKEYRYAHTLSGEISQESPEVAIKPEPAMREVKAENERIANLERDVDVLRAQVAALQEEFSEFKKQFE